MQGNEYRLFWIQHETGLEIIGELFDIIKFKDKISEISNSIRAQILKNETNNCHDRNIKKVRRILFVLRYLRNNCLIEENIIEVSIKNRVKLMGNMFKNLYQPQK
jgi:hypothetical protein